MSARPAPKSKRALPNPAAGNAGAVPSLDVLCEDGPIIAINKPAGLLTQPGPPGNPPTVVDCVKAFLKKKYDKPGNVYLGVPHRLDRPVSGVVVLARNSKAAARLSAQFRERRVKKIYWAIVEGEMKTPDGELTDWLVKTEKPNRAHVVPAVTPDAKLAQLRYRTIGEVEKGTLVEIELLTGRSHQIRVQLSNLGAPIIGDLKYGAKTTLSQKRSGHHRETFLALHARQLSIEHPIRHDVIDIEAPLPATWGRSVTRHQAGH